MMIAYVIAYYDSEVYAPPSVFGVDLGTTFSSAAIYDKATNNYTVFPDMYGNTVIPSIVAFVDGGKILVGHEALLQQEINPNNTFFESKRFIGKTYREIVTQQTLSQYPFHLENINGLPYYRVTAKGH